MVKLWLTFCPKFSIRIVFSGVFDSVVAEDCVFDPLIESSLSCNLLDGKVQTFEDEIDFEVLTQHDHY